jgi:hypothetical protein
MRCLVILATVVSLALAVPQPSWAYHPHVGDRAADIAGRDIVGGKSLHLEAYRGRWVLLDFWSST